MSVSPVDDGSRIPHPNQALARQRRRFHYRGAKSADAQANPRVVASAPAKRRGETERIVSDPTFRTFVATWDRKIRRTIASLRLEEHTDDIVQDIYLFMCTPDKKSGKNGLEKYDPTKASFSCYVYHLVVLKALNYKNKLLRDRLVPMSYELDRDRPERRNSPVARRVGAGEKPDFWLQLERLASEFDADVTDDDGFWETDARGRKTGRYVTRDPGTVLRLLLEGRTRQELGRALQLPLKDVDRLCATLGKNPEVRALLGYRETVD